MSVFIASLNSGSNGNCYYVGNSEEAVLIDAGIICRETEKRMGRLGLDMRRVKAIFISHEHTDHICGLAVLAKKYNLPVYITDNTRQHTALTDKHCVITFNANSQVSIGSLRVTAFSKYHDAADPHSFVVENNGITVGIFTDIGRACDNVIKHFKLCHAAFLEANYDEDMLLRGRYPWFLKNRIRGGNGHLSNTQSLELFTTHRPPFMSHLLLAHLSRDNNNPELVKELFSRHAGNTEIIVASRYEETAVYSIGNKFVQAPASRPQPVKVQQMQLSLF
ncbi:MBL fold metallo-hydrolase [Foetidibacter luteolus]|uniref:MBL fold metallo-hydrolase n=1 Tax=Foetidibacter luteolus TaxID=2608880 RepID=UPI00129C1054|nr:MBL fold metallo-hydrolase [Foetidibacter luteolus]